MTDAARRAISKLKESLPDQVRAKVGLASAQFRVGRALAEADDPRIPAIAAAIRLGHQVRLDGRSNAPRQIHPAALIHDAEGWSVVDGATSERIAISEWKDINISAPRGREAERLRS